MSYENPHVAYFCMEFGLDETLPIYAGGLGVLAGDFLRAAHALALPVVGVGIAWDEGYTVQRISSSGHPEDHPAQLDRKLLRAELPTVVVRIQGRDIPLRIWRCDRFANAPLYLLEPALERDRWITRRLYGGRAEERVAQEIVLGVGGVRALAALGLPIDLYHFNEGHAVFAGLELVRQNRAHGASFEAAWAEARRQIVFTTHTPVDAGNEKHEHEVLRRVGAAEGFSPSELERIGGRPFNMTVAGLRLSRRANAVAELHGKTARHMWSHVEDGAPIDAITNGVDHRQWQDAGVRNARTSGEIDSAHNVCKLELLAEITKRTGVALDPDVLTVGFARRKTAYKRPTLLFHHRARAEALLDSGKLQLVFAGKAHPRDAGGQALVREVVELAKRHPGRVVFLPDYDLRLGRLLTRGCDVWLNTPRRPLEACGTSGMKAAMNGVLNVSILDGWWVEGCIHGVNGWHIGDERVHPSDAAADMADAQALHDLLENQVLPTYYGERARWLRMMRASIDMALTHFTADRMLRDYYRLLYRAPTSSSRSAVASPALRTSSTTA
jgi:starch phosphorylase